MLYRPVPFRSFGGGINLRDQPDVVDETQAIDLLNVIFTDRGGVKQREGYAKLTTTEGTNRYDSLSVFYTAAGTKQIMAGAGNRLDAISTAGAVVTSSTAPTASPHYFARFGSPTVEYLYIANGTDQIRRWDGSAFSAPAGLSTITGRFLAVQAADNRLVTARTATQPSRVFFSNEGAAETFGANDYVDLTPGDGEAIMGLCSWQNYLYVFKETKYFVFTGTSVDSAGLPVFNYRTVDAGVGLASSRCLATSEAGVFVLDRKGVYRLTDSGPQKLSDVIDPIFRGSPSVHFRSNVLNHAQITQAAMEWYEDRLYLALPTGSATTNDRLLVFDLLHEWWTLYDIPCADLIRFRVSSRAELVFAYATGTKHLGRHIAGYTADDMATDGTGGSAISSRWRSGWFDYGTSDMKTIRQSKLWGRGVCSLTAFRDFRDSAASSMPVQFGAGQEDTWGDGTGADLWGGGSGTDLWGPSGAVLPLLVRNAIRGTLFSTQFSNSTLNKTWAIHRLDHHLRESRPPSVVKTEA